MSAITLSVAARPIADVTKTKIPDRETWLKRREGTIGASEVPILFGVAHRTPLQLFNLKTGRDAPEISETIIEGESATLPPNEVGLMLEAPAIAVARLIKPEWRIDANPVPGGYHFAHRGHRISATPDAHIYAPEEDGPGALQIKTVGEPTFRESWLEDGALKPPLWVVIQTMIDAALSGCSWGRIGVMTRGSFGARFQMHRVAVRQDVLARAFALVDDFWRRVEEDRPYDPDYAKDGAALAALYADDNGDILALEGERAATMAKLLDERAALKEAEAAAKKAREPLENQIAHILGNAAGARLPDGRVVTFKTTKRAAYQVKETSYRTLRVSDPASSAKRVTSPRSATAIASGDGAPL
jgi:predicted phage-related endonuclease